MSVGTSGGPTGKYLCQGIGKIPRLFKPREPKRRREKDWARFAGSRKQPYREEGTPGGGGGVVVWNGHLEGS